MLSRKAVEEGIYESLKNLSQSIVKEAETIISLAELQETIIQVIEKEVDLNEVEKYLQDNTISNAQLYQDVKSLSQETRTRSM